MEALKGCSSRLSPEPISLIPPLNPIPRPDRPWGHGAKDETPAQDKAWGSDASAFNERVWFSLALHPEHKPRPEDCEMFLRLLASARHGFIFEVAGGADAADIRIAIDTKDVPVLMVATQALHLRVGTGHCGEHRLPIGEPVMTEFVPRPPYVDTFTRLDGLPRLPVGLLLQTLRTLPKGYSGCYQVCAQPPQDERWLHNIQSLQDHRFRMLKEPAGPEGMAPISWTQQVPSASLPHLTQEAYEKNHADRAYYFMLSRIALWYPRNSPRNDSQIAQEDELSANDQRTREHALAYLRCLMTPVLAIRQNGRAMGTIPPDHACEVFEKGPSLSQVLSTGQVHRHGVLVNTDELASFVHMPPLDVIEELRLDHLLREPLAPEATDPDGTGLGHCIDGDRQVRVTIPRSSRCSHAHVIGMTGYGKSTLLTSMLFDDAHRGDGILVLDPHEQLVAGFADSLPPDIAERTRWIDFNDPKHAVLYNPLRAGGSSQAPAEIADDFIGGFKDMTSGWGDRLEHINRNIICAVAELPEGSLLGAMLSLERKSVRGGRIRQQLIENSSDPLVRWFFKEHFKVYSNADLNPAHHKLSKLLHSGPASLCMRQPDNRLNISEWMERGEIVLVNLGSISREYKHLLGSFLLANIFTAAQARGNIRNKNLKPFHVYIDECHRFSPSLQSKMVSEVRKNNVSLTLAHQHMHQFPREVARGLEGVGTSVTFNVNQNDAEAMARSMQGRVQAKQIMALRHFEAYARVGHEIVRLHTPSYKQLPSETGMLRKIYERSVRDWYVDRRHLEAQTNAIIDGVNGSLPPKPVPAPTVPKEALPDDLNWPS